MRWIVSPASTWSVALNASIWWAFASYKGELWRPVRVSLRGAWVYRLPVPVTRWRVTDLLC